MRDWYWTGTGSEQCTRSARAGGSGTSPPRETRQRPVTPRASNGQWQCSGRACMLAPRHSARGRVYGGPSTFTVLISAPRSPNFYHFTPRWPHFLPILRRRPPIFAPRAYARVHNTCQPHATCMPPRRARQAPVSATRHTQSSSQRLTARARSSASRAQVSGELCLYNTI